MNYKDIKFVGWDYNNKKEIKHLKRFIEKASKSKTYCYGIIDSTIRMESNFVNLYVAILAGFANNTCVKETQYIITNKKDEVILIYPNITVGNIIKPIKISSSNLIVKNENRLYELTHNELNDLRETIKFIVALKEEQKQKN